MIRCRRRHPSINLQWCSTYDHCASIDLIDIKSRNDERVRINLLDANGDDHEHGSQRSHLLSPCRREFTSQPVDEDVLRQLIDAAIETPSAVNQQPWLHRAGQSITRAHYAQGKSPNSATRFCEYFIDLITFRRLRDSQIECYGLLPTDELCDQALSVMTRLERKISRCTQGGRLSFAPLERTKSFPLRNDP